jgi:hypothetical protein
LTLQNLTTIHASELRMRESYRDPPTKLSTPTPGGGFISSFVRSSPINVGGATLVEIYGPAEIPLSLHFMLLAEYAGRF